MEGSGQRRPTVGALCSACRRLSQQSEQILLGFDHLLFVLALLFLVEGWRRLVATITAFTIAHSLTLAAATFGWVQVPQAPLEAIIALSILILTYQLLT